MTIAGYRVFRSKQSKLPGLVGLLVLIGLLLGGMTALAAIEAQARLDRHSMQLGDSVDLTVRVPSADVDDEPDFTVLATDFEVLAPRRNSRHIITNGRAESSTEWRVTLLPRRAGTLTIPAVAIGAAETAPLTLEVTPPNPATSGRGSGEPVFIEATVDRDRVYVQQQLRLTLRIHHSVPLDNMSLSEPDFDNATVMKLSQDSFSRDIDGVPYVVHELRYAIFPEQAGELTIPELVFSGSQSTRTRSIFDLPGSGPAIRKLTPQIRVTVRPVPAAFTGPLWLPASNLTLVQSWSDNPLQLTAGESITRTINLQAEGLPADLLPALPQPTLATARLYDDQPLLDNQIDELGVNGKRVERTALIATQAGPLELPGLKVIWWDIESDTQQEATLAPQQLLVKPAANTAQPAPSQLAPAEPGLVTAPEQRLTTEAAVAHASPRLWQVASAVLALLWLITLGLYLRARSAPRVQPIQADVAADAESERFQQFQSACKTHAAEQARRALLSWARMRFADPQLRTIAQLCAQPELAAATTEIVELDEAVTGAGKESAAWRGDRLLQRVSAARSELRPDSDNPSLPTLYPAV